MSHASEAKVRVYIGTLFEGIEYLEILFANLGPIDRSTHFAEPDMFLGISKYFDIVDNPEEAEYFLMPYPYSRVQNRGNYIEEFRMLAQQYHKKVIMFVLGDNSDSICLENTIVFRMSTYRHTKQQYEQVMPAHAVDLGVIYGVNLRKKTSRPTIGFCGWGNIPQQTKRAKFMIKHVFFKILSLYNKKWAAHIPGVVLRRQLLTTLQASPLLACNFIIRDAYSASHHTITTDPNQARREYVSNMQMSDYALCPRGDGNFSVRFYEALSLGRIPILPDTDVVLPFEDYIDYNRAIIKVPQANFTKIDQYIAHFHQTISEEEFIEMQHAARALFAEHLEIKKFFTLISSRTFLSKL